MISSALDAVVQELNQFLKIKFQQSEDIALLSNLANLDGSVATKEKNKIVVTLVNIQEDRIAYQKNHPEKRIGEYQPIYLNIQILISSHFDEKLTKESLKFLSAVVGFFQSHRVFTPSSTPSLDSAIEKLAFEIVNLDFKEQSSLFSSLGVKYLPSILYRMRMLAIDEEGTQPTAEPITEKGTESSLD